MAVSGHVMATLARLRAALEERFGRDLLEMRLFGSFARGQAHAESDVDVFVRLASMGWPEKRDVINLCADIGLEADLLLSPTVLGDEQYRTWREQERPLIMDIENQGIPI